MLCLLPEPRRRPEAGRLHLRRHHGPAEEPHRRGLYRRLRRPVPAEGRHRQAQPAYTSSQEIKAEITAVQDEIDSLQAGLTGASNITAPPGGDLLRRVRRIRVRADPGGAGGPDPRRPGQAGRRGE